MDYPAKLPTAEKPVWFYRDCFPASMPLKLTSIFCHRNYHMDMHTHDFYEINLVVDGEGMHYTDAASYPVRRGDVCIIPPDCRHGYFNGGGLDIFHILLHRNYFSKYSSDLAMLTSFHILFHGDARLHARLIPYFHAEGKVYEELVALLYRLDELEQNTMNSSVPDRADYLLSYSLTLAVIATLCKEYTRQYASPPVQTRSDDVGIIAATEFIHKNYAGKITLSDLCQVAMMSKTVLSEKFKLYYGLSPAAYVNRYRILVAKNALMETDKTIAEIAQETGFFDASHFLKTYEKLERESPAAFREGLRTTPKEEPDRPARSRSAKQPAARR